MSIIFNDTTMLESFDNNIISSKTNDNDMEITMESMVEMGVEFEKNIYKLNTSLHIANLLLEQNSQSAEEFESLMEATIFSFFKNMKKQYKSMADRIRLFFDSIFNKVNAFASDGKKFMKLYKDLMLKAARHNDVEWITYEERAFTATSDIDKTLNLTIQGVHGAIDAVHKMPDDVISSKSEEEYEKIFADISNLFPKEDDEEDEKEKQKSENIKNKKIPKTGVVETLNPQTLNEFIRQVDEYVSGGKAKIQRCMNECNNLCSAAISKLDKFESRVKSNTEDDSKITVVTKACSEISKAIRESQKETSKITAVYTKSYRYSLKVLRAFVYKNAKIIPKPGTVKPSATEKIANKINSKIKKKDKDQSTTKESTSLLENIMDELQ